jgi:hypothetical protein
VDAHVRLIARPGRPLLERGDPGEAAVLADRQISEPVEDGDSVAENGHVAGPVEEPESRAGRDLEIPVQENGLAVPAIASSRSETSHSA